MDAAVAVIDARYPAARRHRCGRRVPPHDISLPAAAVLSAVADHAAVTVIAGMTGVRARRCRGRHVAGAARVRHRRDRARRRARSRSRTGRESCRCRTPTTRSAPSYAWSSTRCATGVPLERMAILYGAAEPYARLVHEQLGAAGIPHNGAAVRTLAESVLGRSLLGLLALPDRDFHRHDVMALLASAPVCQRGRPVPVGVAGSDQPRRGRRAGRGAVARAARAPRPRSLERQLAEELAVPDRDPRPERYERELAATRALAEFVGRVGRGRCAPTAAWSWRELAGWAQRLVRDYLGRRAAPSPLARAGTAGRRARSKPRSSGSPASTRSRPRPASTCSGAPSRSSSTPTSAGSVGSATASSWATSRWASGSTSTACSSCGLAEGTFPAPRPRRLAPPRRRSCGSPSGVLPLRRARVDDDHRRLLAALAGAEPSACCSTRAATSAAPPSACRRGSCSTPSRRSAARDSTPTTSPGCTPTGSQRCRRSRQGSHASSSPRPSRSTGCARCSTTRAPAARSRRTSSAFTTRVCATGSSARVARASDDVHALRRQPRRRRDRAAPPPATSSCRRRAWRRGRRARSTTSWSRCCGSRSRSSPRSATSCRRSTAARSCTTSSTQFLREVLARPGGAPGAGRRRGPQPTASGWPEIAEARCAEYEADGLTGRRLFWHRDRRRHPRRPRPLPRRGRRRSRREVGARTIATELRFGLPGRRRAGRRARAVRRADAALPGRRRPGRPYGRRARWSSSTTRPASALSGARRRRPHGRRHAPAAARVRARRSRVVRRRRPRRSAPRTGSSAPRASSAGPSSRSPTSVDARLDAVLRTIVDGIEAGVFPCRVDPPSTWEWRGRTYADPDARGTRRALPRVGAQVRGPRVARPTSQLAEPEDAAVGMPFGHGAGSVPEVGDDT